MRCSTPSADKVEGTVFFMILVGCKVVQTVGLTAGIRGIKRKVCLQTVDQSHIDFLLQTHVLSNTGPSVLLAERHDVDILQRKRMACQLVNQLIHKGVADMLPKKSVGSQDDRHVRIPVFGFRMVDAGPLFQLLQTEEQCLHLPLPLLLCVPALHAEQTLEQRAQQQPEIQEESSLSGPVCLAT